MDVLLGTGRIGKAPPAPLEVGGSHLCPGGLDAGGGLGNPVLQLKEQGGAPEARLGGLLRGP